MMHGRERSDLVIVAMKSPNKTGGLAAEAMERRAGAEENASQHRTRRTQSRGSVSEAELLHRYDRHLTDQDASGCQAQGSSSARRRLGQLLTSLVSTSVK